MNRSLSVIALAMACAMGCASVGSQQARSLAEPEPAVLAEAPQAPERSEITQAGFCSDCGCSDGTCGCSDGIYSCENGACGCTDQGCGNGGCAHPGASYYGHPRHGRGLAAQPYGSHHRYDNVYDFNPGPPVGQTAYPYYTVRGPRDFLLNNPAPIGPF